MLSLQMLTAGRSSKVGRMHLAPNTLKNSTCVHMHAHIISTINKIVLKCKASKMKVKAGQRDERGRGEIRRGLL